MRRVCILLALLAAAGGYNAASAGSLTQKDVQIIAKAIGFLEPPPSGAAKMPSAVASFTEASIISSSFTATAAPPLSRTASSTRKSPNAFGTRKPLATVCASFQNSLSGRRPFDHEIM